MSRVEHTKPIAESKNFIVLDRYVSEAPRSGAYQSEAALENELVQDLRKQGYEFLPELTSQPALKRKNASRWLNPQERGVHSKTKKSESLNKNRSRSSSSSRMISIVKEKRR